MSRASGTLIGLASLSLGLVIGWWIPRDTIRDRPTAEKSSGVATTDLGTRHPPESPPEPEPDPLPPPDREPAVPLSPLPKEQPEENDALLAARERIRTLERELIRGARLRNFLEGDRLLKRAILPDDANKERARRELRTLEVMFRSISNSRMERASAHAFNSLFGGQRGALGSGLEDAWIGLASVAANSAVPEYDQRVLAEIISNYVNEYREVESGTDHDGRIELAGTLWDGLLEEFQSELSPPIGESLVGFLQTCVPLEW